MRLFKCEVESGAGKDETADGGRDKSTKGRNGVMMMSSCNDEQLNRRFGEMIAAAGCGIAGVELDCNSTGIRGSEMGGGEWWMAK